MPECPRCEETYDTEELVKHVREGVHHVHCPECGHTFGVYNERTR